MLSQEGNKHDSTKKLADEVISFLCQADKLLDWDKEDEKGTILQVVRNPGWLTPYFACVIVALGMMIQFFSHLVAFATKRRTT